MLRKLTLLVGSTLIVAAAFLFTLSVLDRGFAASCLAVIHFINP
jgi:hypothetical protein